MKYPKHNMVLSSLWNECHLSYSVYMLDSVTEIELGPKEGALRNSADSTEGVGEVTHSLWRLCRSNSAPGIPSGNSVAAVTPLSGAQQTLGYKISLYFSSQWSLHCAEHKTIIAAVACTHWNLVLTQQLIHMTLFLIVGPICGPAEKKKQEESSKNLRSRNHELVRRG